MRDDDHIRQQLNRPLVPDELESKIRATWLQQKKPDRRHNKTAKYLFLAASIFGIAASGILLAYLESPPDLISIAISDIHSDTKKHIGITLPIDSIVEQAKINLPPPSMPIEMTKACTLNGNKTVHIKVAGVLHGEVHLFLKNGNFDIPAEKPKGGSAARMPWKLIKPRHDLTVLVLYTNDMNPDSVEKLIQTMFFA